ncbi:MAG: hypothetical protein M1274_06990 [Actinobacteria bacterium]|nr:hypothetical protein [Actinomycetota bacterium]
MQSVTRMSANPSRQTRTWLLLAALVGLLLFPHYVAAQTPPDAHKAYFPLVFRTQIIPITDWPQVRALRERDAVSVLVPPP